MPLQVTIDPGGRDCCTVSSKLKDVGNSLFSTEELNLSTDVLRQLYVIIDQFEAIKLLNIVIFFI